MRWHCNRLVGVTNSAFARCVMELHRKLVHRVSRLERRHAHAVTRVNRQLVHAVAQPVQEPEIPPDDRLEQLRFALVDVHASTVAKRSRYHTR